MWPRGKGGSQALQWLLTIFPFASRKGLDHGGLVANQYGRTGRKAFFFFLKESLCKRFEELTVLWYGMSLEETYKVHTKICIIAMYHVPYPVISMNNELI